MVQGLLSTQAKQTLHVYTDARSVRFLQCRWLMPGAHLVEPKQQHKDAGRCLHNPGTRGCVRRSPVTLTLCWLLLEELCLVVFFLLSSVYFTVRASQKNRK